MATCTSLPSENDSATNKSESKALASQSLTKINLQFYLKQMYACNQFNQTQMTTWENKDKAIKNNWTMAKQYFKGLVRDFEVYEQNSGGTAGKNKYESANHAADTAKGNELCQYIAQIAAAAVAKEEKHNKIAASIRNTTQRKTDKMAAQLKSLHDAVAKLTWVRLSNIQISCE